MIGYQCVCADSIIFLGANVCFFSIRSKYFKLYFKIITYKFLFRMFLAIIIPIFLHCILKCCIFAK